VVVDAPRARYHAGHRPKERTVTWSTLFQLILYLVVLMAIAVIPITVWLVGAVVVTNQKRDTAPASPAPAPPAPTSG
jgi:hypothetical protein